MNDPKFPLGKPINRPAPVTPKPEREDYKKGFYRIGEKLHTCQPITGPRKPTPPPVDASGDTDGCC